MRKIAVKRPDLSFLRFYSATIVCLIITSLSASAQQTIIVDKSGGGNFTTIQAAFNSLNNKSLSQKTIVRVKPGLYTEHLVLENISGTSSLKNIVVESFSGDTADVIIGHDSSSIFPFYSPVELRKVSHVTFQNLSFRGPTSEGYIVGIDEGAGNITFRNNHFIYNNSGSNLSAVSLMYNFNTNDLTIDSIFFFNNLCHDLDLYSRYITIFNLKHLGMYNNTIVNKRGYSNVPIIQARTVHIEGNSFQNAAIGTFSSSDKVRILRNSSWYRGSPVALYTGVSSDSAAIVANNFLVSIRSTGILVSGGNVRILNNNIYSFDSSTQNFGIYLGGNDSLEIVNNIIAGLGSKATGIYFVDTILGPTFKCDYNNYYFPQGSFSTHLRSISYHRRYSVAQHISELGIDSHSISINPLFVTDTNLHVRNASLKGKGLHIPGITVDFDGDLRDPDDPIIGADMLSETIDLIPDVFNSFTGTFYPGKSMEVEYTVNNAGGLDLSGLDWYDKIYLSTDQLIDGNDILLKTVSNDFSVPGGQGYTRRQSVSIPYIPGGSYYFLLQTNSSNIQFEDTTNNLLVSQVMNLPVPKLPDLKVLSVDVPTSIFSGKSFTLSWTVKNSGNAPTSGTWSDYVYVSTDDALLNSPLIRSLDTVLKVKVVSPTGLKPNESYTSTATMTLPIKFSGKVYYRVQTNANDAIFEQDTTFTGNGRISNALNVVQSPLPDLAVTDLNIQSSAFSGDTVPVNWTVTNVGKQKTYRTDRYYSPSPLQDNPRMWTDLIVISRKNYYIPKSKENITKAYYTRPSNDELEVDSSYTVNRSINFNRCEYGKYYVFAVSNYSYTTFELRYDNNVQLIDSIEVILQPNPDLTPSSMSVTNSPASGQSITINYTVLNDGFDDKNSTYHKDRFYLHTTPEINFDDAEYIGQAFGPDTVLQGDDYTNVVTFDVPYDVFGDYYLTMVTDAHDRICEEPHEDNNGKTIGPFSIARSPLPDLTATLTPVPDTVIAGQNLTVIVNTRNEGDGDAVQSRWDNEIFLVGLNRNILRRYSINPVLPSNDDRNDTINLSIPINMEPGTYHFEIEVDYRDRVFEYTGESNNLYVSPSFTLLRDNDRVPDLEVVGLRVQESSPKGGDVITLEVDVRNNSRSTSMSGWKDHIYLRDDRGLILKTLTHDHMGHISRNETITRLVEFQLPYDARGDALIEYHSNALNNPIEYITANNSKTKELTIAEYIPPDLDPQSILTPSCCFVYALQFDTIEVVVKNNGPGTVAGQQYFAKLYLSDDEFIDRNDYVLATHQQFGGINPGSSETLRIPVKYPSTRSGDFFYIVDVDVEEDIYEGVNEDNNRQVSGYTVTLSNQITDLALDSFKVSNYSGPNDPTLYVDYQFSKPINDSLLRSWTNRIVLSRERKYDPTTILSSSIMHTGLLPAGTDIFTGFHYAGIPRDIEPGYYFIGMVLDQFNEVYESDETNNTLFSADSFYFDFSVPLTLDVQKDTFWYEGRFASKVYYRVDRPEDNGMIIDLDVSDKNASTEIYHRAGRIPDRTNYDHRYNNPYLADQQIVVPVTDTAVRDYMYVQPAYVPPVYSLADPDNKIIDKVPYSILCSSAEFSIYSVFPENGSVYGNTSVEVTGFDFDSTTSFYLVNGTDTVFPISTGLLNSSHVVLYMDLREHTLGDYSVYAEKPGSKTSLKDGFEVQSVGFEEPWVNIDLTKVRLIRKQTVMNVNFGNYSNTDGLDYWLIIAISNTTGNLENLNTFYVGSSEEHLNEEYGFDGNPTGDSTFYDFDGIRYYAYWLPKLAAKSQTTFTYIMNHATEDTVFVIAHLFRQPMSDYTLSGRIEDAGLSATMYELYGAFSELAGQLNKAGSFDCDNIDIKNVQKQLAKQTLLHAESVHGGVGTFSGATSVKDLGKKAYESWKGDVLLPFQANNRSSDVQKEMFKATVLEEKGYGDIAKDYIKKLRHPIDAITGKVYNPEPPFSDLVKGVFGCLDNDPDFARNAIDRCLVCSKHKYPDGGYYRTCHDICNNPPPEPPNLKTRIIRWVKSKDPNEIEGPEGVTELRYVDQESNMPYTIRFENKSDATAPAIMVSINNPLDTAFRLQSFKLTEIGFGDTIILLDGENNLNRIFDLGPKYNFLQLHVVAGLDLINGKAIWRMTTIDPKTGNPVSDPFSGFLPPNDTSGTGEGYVKYEVELKPGIPAQYRVNNRADIIFDQNEIIGTNTWTNIVIDAEPFSVVNPLPDFSPPKFTVTWTGSDGEGGPGIDGYTVYVSRDNEPYEKWISFTTDTSAQFVGEVGSSYQFYSVVHLLNGESEPAPAIYDAMTSVKEGHVYPVSDVNYISVYPNPGNSKLNIGQNIPQLLEVRLMNLNGGIIGDYKMEEVKNTIDVSSLPPGFYIVQIYDGTNLTNFKWIKQ